MGKASKKNVLVVTHRRSGTHLTIDAIRNNFSKLREHPLAVLETLHPNHPKHVELDVMERQLAAGQHVIKTHYRFDDIDSLPRQESQLFRKLLGDSRLIYVVRNGLDVMVSLYEFRKAHDPSVRELTFSDFIRQPTFDRACRELSKVDYWRQHVQNWLDSEWGKQFTIVRFEDWAEDYAGTLKRLSRDLGLRRDWLRKDVRLQKHRNAKKSINRTWVEPRKGIVGDFVNYFSESDYDYFWARCGSLMERLGYGDTRNIADVA